MLLKSMRTRPNLVLAFLFILSFISFTSSSYAGWVSPTSYSDPESKWTNEANSYDNNTATYASDNSLRKNNAAYIILNLSSAIDCERIKVNADYSSSDLRRVEIDVQNSSDNSWTNVHSGSIGNATDTEITFTQRNIKAARFRYNYKVSTYIYWLYEFTFYETPAAITLPTCSSEDQTSVEETIAIFHGQLVSDGGEPCEYRFEYGTTTSYGSDTGWVSSKTSGEAFSHLITGLTDSTTYHFRAQVRNSAGTNSGLDKTFTTGMADSGWVTPTSFTDSSGDWEDEGSAYDDNTVSYAKEYHDIYATQWSPYINYSRSAIDCNKVRLYAKGNPGGMTYYVDQVDVDVYRDGSWVDVYEGTFTNMAFQEFTFTKGVVTEARVRFRANSTNAGLYFELYEFDFFRVVTVDISGTHDGSTPVVLRINGAYVDSYTGASPYLFTANVGSGDKVLVYYNNNTSGGDGAVATVVGGDDITDLNLTANKLVVRNDYGSSITTADLASAYGTDSDIPYTVSGNNITVNSSTVFEVPSGHTFDLDGNTLTLNNNLVTDGTFTQDDGTVVIAGTSALSGSAAATFNNLTINNTLTAPAGTMNVAGAFTNNGTFTHNSGTVAFTGASASIAGTSTTTFNNLTVSGTLTAPSGTMNIAGAFTNNGTFTHNSGSVVFAGASNTIAGSSVTRFYNLDITGSLTASSGTTEVARMFRLNGGTFTHNSGTIELVDSSVISYIYGSSTFYNLKCVTAGKQIRFGVGTDQTVANTFNVAGVSGNNVSLRSTSLGTKWDITFPNGTQSISYATVRDSDANTNTVTVAGGTNSGNNNANWVFSAARYWIGGTGSWSDTSHWSLTSGGAGGASVPNSAELAVFNSSSGSGTCTVNTNVDVSGLSLGTSSITITNSSYTVAVGSGGGFTMTAGTFNGGSGSLDVNGSCVLSSGTFTSTSGTFNLSGDFTNNGATFNHNSGTFAFDGGAAQVLGGSATSTFYTLNVSNSSTLSVSGDAVVNNSFAPADGNTVSVMNGGTLTLGGSFTISGDVSVSSGGTLELTGGQTTAFDSNSSFTVSGGGSVSKTGTGDFTLNLQGDVNMAGTSGSPVNFSGGKLTLASASGKSCDADYVSMTSVSSGGTYLTISGTAWNGYGFNGWGFGSVSGSEVTARITSGSSVYMEGYDQTAGKLYGEATDEDNGENSSSGDVGWCPTSVYLAYVNVFENKIKEGLHVKWKTSSERNNAGFEVYRKVLTNKDNSLDFYPKKPAPCWVKVGGFIPADLACEFGTEYLAIDKGVMSVSAGKVAYAVVDIDYAGNRRAMLKPMVYDFSAKKPVTSVIKTADEIEKQEAESKAVVEHINIPDDNVVQTVKSADKVLDDVSKDTRKKFGFNRMAFISVLLAAMGTFFVIRKKRIAGYSSLLAAIVVGIISSYQPIFGKAGESGFEDKSLSGEGYYSSLSYRNYNAGHDGFNNKDRDISQKDNLVRKDSNVVEEGSSSEEAALSDSLSLAARKIEASRKSYNNRNNLSGQQEQDDAEGEDIAAAPVVPVNTEGKNPVPTAPGESSSPENITSVSAKSDDVEVAGDNKDDDGSKNESEGEPERPVVVDKDKDKNKPLASKPAAVVPVTPAKMVNEGISLPCWTGGKPDSRMKNLPDVVARIETKDKGLYYISLDELAGLGIDTSREIKVTSGGESVDLWTAKNGSDTSEYTFITGSCLAFYAKEYRTPYSEKNIFWIHQAGNDAAYAARNTTAVDESLPAGLSYYEATEHIEENVFRGEWLNSFLDSRTCPATEIKFNLENVVAGEPAKFRMKINSNSPTTPSSHFTVKVNGQDIGEQTITSSGLHEVENIIPGNVLIDGENTVSLALVGDVVTVRESDFIDWAEIVYPKKLSSVDGYITLSIPDNKQGRVVVVDMPEENILVVDITDENHPVVVNTLSVIDQGDGRFTLQFYGVKNHTYIASCVSSLKAGDDVLAMESPRDPVEVNCDYLIVYAPHLKDAAQQFKAYHEAEGLVVEMFELSDALSSGNWGLYGPEAIEALVREGRPSYMLILGALTDDYLDPAKASEVALAVPSRLVTLHDTVTPVDYSYAFCKGGNLPYVSVGRIPAATNEEALAVFVKVKARSEIFFRNSASVFLIDESMPQFERNADAAFSAVTFGKKVRIHMQDPTYYAEAKARLLSAWNSGCDAVLFSGHAAQSHWHNNSVFATGDMALLAEQPRLPLVISLSCRAAAAHHSDSLSESLLFTASKGASTFVGSTGFASSEFQGIVGEKMLGSLNKYSGLRMGDAFRAAQVEAAATKGARDVVETFVLFGDPAAK